MYTRAEWISVEQTAVWVTVVWVTVVWVTVVWVTVVWVTVIWVTVVWVTVVWVTVIWVTVVWVTVIWVTVVNTRDEWISVEKGFGFSWCCVLLGVISWGPCSYRGVAILSLTGWFGDPVITVKKFECSRQAFSLKRLAWDNGRGRIPVLLVVGICDD